MRLLIEALCFGGLFALLIGLPIGFVMGSPPAGLLGGFILPTVGYLGLGIR